jgi:hypothetical protein
MKKQLILVCVLVVSLMSSCMKPYQKQKIVEVKPNETAYLIPLENGTQTNQTKLKSQDYLEKNKVVAKRIYIPTQWQKTGRGNNSGYWMPSDTVIIVNRTPVTREWNQAGGGSNKTSNDAIKVESKESIGFEVCITATASIPEEWATLFLYSYSGRSLSDLMDSDVRAYVQTCLTTAFGDRTLTQGQNERSVVFSQMAKDVSAHFALYGIKIMNIGSAGQFSYENKAIQDAIDEKYSSEMNIQTAQNKVISANKFAQAKAAIEAQSHLDADIAIKLAFADALKNGKLQVPSTIAGGNFSLLELYGLTSMSNTSKTKR